MTRTSDLETLIRKTLRECHAIFKADRAWLLSPLDPSIHGARVHYEVTSPKYPGAFKLGVPVENSRDNVRLFRDVFRVDSPVAYGPGHRKLTRFVLRFGVRSQLCVAIRPRVGEAWMLGLHQCSYAREWTADEQWLLHQVSLRLADILSNTLLLRDLRKSKEALQEREWRLMEAQRVGRMSTAEIDRKGNIQGLSEEALRLFGKKPGQGFITSEELLSYCHPEDRPKIRHAVKSAFKTGGRTAIDYWMKVTGMPAGYFESAFYPVSEGTRKAERVVVITQEITERKRAEEILKRYSGWIAEAQEAERRRVARELHDGVIQVLGSAYLRINSVRTHAKGIAPKLALEIEKSAAFLGDAIEEVRRICHHLRPSVLDDLGLVPAIRSLCHDFEQQQGIPVTLEVPRKSSDLRKRQAGIEVTVYRVIQETLNNVQKHSEATRAWVSLKFGKAGLTAEVRDNGKGFRKAGSRTSGLGLLHVRERVAASGGRVVIDSQPGKGTRVTIRVPLSGKATGKSG